MTRDIISKPTDKRIEKFTPTATVIVEYEHNGTDGVIIVDRKHSPSGWCFPGGKQDFPSTIQETIEKLATKRLNFHDKKYLALLKESATVGETLERCAIREIYEETNLWVTLYNDKHPIVQSHPERDPRKFFGFVIDNVYIGRGAGTLQAKDDARGIKLINISELEELITSGMPFDHAQSARLYLNRRYALEEQLRNYTQSIPHMSLPRYSFGSELELATYQQRLNTPYPITLTPEERT